MGDLISRSSLIEELNTWAMQCKSIAEISILGAVVSIIENQPTAYNVDKVIEQLEDEKGIAFLTLANTGNKVKDAIYDEVMVYLNTAIEIVKVGGVE